MDEWYWIRIGNDWSPAVKDKHSGGGWTNLDTWEDFHGEVEESVKMFNPKQTKFLRQNRPELLLEKQPKQKE